MLFCELTVVTDRRTGRKVKVRLSQLNLQYIMYVPKYYVHQFTYMYINVPVQTENSLELNTLFSRHIVYLLYIFVNQININ